MRGTTYGWASITLVVLAFAAATNPNAVGAAALLSLVAIGVGVAGIVKRGTTYHVLAGILGGIVVLAPALSAEGLNDLGG